jgi:hypothetical protein
MAQPIKYNTGAKTANCCIRKGNYDIGIVPQYEYGPTSGTGFYAGYTIPAGGFVSYQNKASQGPSIYVMQDINEVVAYGQNLNIGTQTTPEDVFYACASLSTIALVNIDYPELPSIDNNILTLDAGYTASNPWVGTDWFDITGNGPSGVLNGTAQFSSGSSIVNYSDSRISQIATFENAMVLVPAFASTLSQFTVNVWINSTGNGYSSDINVVGQQYSASPIYAPLSDCNFLIRGNNVNGYDGVIRSFGTDYVVNFGSVGGGWTNLTFTYDGGSLTAYVDGGQIGPPVFIGAIPVSSNGLQTIIGGTINATNGMGQPRYFDGGINVVNIYDVALNSGEVNALYNLYRNNRF